MEEVENHMEREILRMEVESRSSNEEFARVAVAVFMSRLDPTMEEIDDVKTAVSEAVTNAVIHGYQGKGGDHLHTGSRGGAGTDGGDTG